MPIFGGDTPVGAGMIWYTNTAPSNWLICDGTAVSRTTYGALFAVLGTTYGTGNGTTTFNLPDLRQKFPMGKAASGTGNTLAGTGGTIDHKHTSASHSHTVPAHYHGMGSGATLNISTITTSTAPAHEHFVIAAASVTATALTNLNFVASSRNAGNDFSYGIDNGGTGTAATIGRSSANNAHSHTFTVGSGSFSGLIGLVSGGVNGNATMTCGSTTPGDTGTNNPPYLVVNYIIKAA